MTTATTAVVQLMAARALIMGGTGTPDPDTSYVNGMAIRYIPDGFGGYDGDSVAVHTPEQFFPTNGTMTFDDSVAQGVVDLNDAVDQHSTGPNPADSFVIVGYSQSTRIATVVKNGLIEDHVEGTDYPDYRFVLLSNVNRPNGGIMNRLQFLGGVPMMGITFDGATRTDSGGALETVDITIRHDGWSDFPVRPLNPVALANAFAGIAIHHPTYPTLENPELVYQGSQGDTSYYMIVPKIVPLLQPLADVGVPMPILMALNEPLLVIIEDAYDRETNPGVPVSASLIPIGDPVKLVVNLARSIPAGIDAGLAEGGLGRPLKTTPSGPYGVGGPQLPDPSQDPPADTALRTADSGGSGRSADSAATGSAPTVSDTAAGTPEKPKTTRPSLLRPKFRGPIQFDRPRRMATGSAADRPAVDRPLRKVLSALTGQRPDRRDDQPAGADQGATKPADQAA